ncbi:MAG TPA: UDPGP type 1 family protein [Planctomycetaceae bacterium]|nr:UDPGP type 1 family protein [Planctomycetaceae bacterium]
MTVPEKEWIFARLARYGQEHLLRFWDELEPEQREALWEEIDRIDFALIERLYRGGMDDERVRQLAARSTSPPFFRLGDPGNPIPPGEARRRGEEALRAGEVGAVLVAGGQGTRLGFDRPKGMYPIGPVSGHSLFQIHAEKVLATGHRYGRPVPLCLMTSPVTHDATVTFFAQHGRFGLAEDQLHVFCQGTMPAVDAASGKVLLADRGHLALSPDGHGGMPAAISSSGLLGQLHRRGIRRLFYFQVDNPLVRVCDPEFIGYHLLARSELSTQVVRKTSPADRVGNVVQVDGRLHVIEYSDLPEEVAQRRNPDGSLAIWAGSIAVHVFDVDFLRRMATEAERLPFHLAHKKVAYVDEDGRRVEPDRPNAIKFERFIFDLMPAAANAIVVEVDRRTDFAPLKNASGHQEDTPETVRVQMVALHARWLEAAGVSVPPGVPVEISPLVALDADQLAANVPHDLRITGPTYLGPTLTR